jgi:phytoene synthase
MCYERTIKKPYNKSNIFSSFRMNLLTSSQLIKRYGTSYYLASLRFARSKREEIFELYKFVRLPDQIIDTPGVDKQSALHQLELERAHRKTVYNKKTTSDDKYGNICLLFCTYDIPFEYAELFWKAMKQDCNKTRYQTYQELHDYMIGSAEVVGLMMNRLL